MAVRRSYTKVRSGCLTCKQRKVRCDELRPCSNCTRLDLDCVYLRPSPAATQGFLAFDYQNAHTSRRLSMEMLKLMHHYTAYTSVTFSFNPVLQLLWRGVVPKYAFEHDCLLHGIFAIAARHQLHQRDGFDSRLSLAASQSEQNAISAHVQLLNHITEHNCHALYALSQILIGVCYSRLSQSLKHDGLSPPQIISGMVDVFCLLKGVLAVAKSSTRWLRAGSLQPMMNDNIAVQEEEHGSTDHQPFVALRPLVEQLYEAQSDSGAVGNEDHERTRTLLSTIHVVGELFSHGPRPTAHLNDIIGLPAYFDLAYLALLRKMDEAALVILAYYGAAIHDLNHVWTFNLIGSRLVHAIREIIGPQWASALAWPEEQIT